MPKITDNTLLQRAIEPALNDRTSFLDAMRGDVDTLEVIEAEIKVIGALRGKRLATLNEDARRAAMLAFLYAEQWESSYADSDPRSQAGARARKDAARFHETRVRLFGRTAFEAMVADATSVDVRDILKSMKAARAG